MVLSAILLILAAISNAVMDSLEEGRFQRSVFRKFNPKFWYKEESWKYAKRVFKYPIDAWHLAKSLMCIFITFAISVNIHFPLLGSVVILGGIWILIFNLLYNKLLRKKPTK